MQVNHSTGEVYASSPALGNAFNSHDETIDLMTLAKGWYEVICWREQPGGDAEARWTKEFRGTVNGEHALLRAVAEYNRWAKVPETEVSNFEEASA